MATEYNSNTRREYLKELIEKGYAIKNQQPNYIQINSAYQFATASLKDPNYRNWKRNVIEFTNKYLKNHVVFGLINGEWSYETSFTINNVLIYLEKAYGDIDFWESQEQTTTTNLSSKTKELPMYDVFISHASADKADYVDELKQSLDKLKVNIFYDSDTLEWGDDWKKKLLEGVEKAEFAIIVISENFFGREWTERELNDFLGRQNRKGQKIILPILHNITMAQLQVQYPAIADIQSLDSSKYTCDEIALKFASQLIKRLKN